MVTDIDKSSSLLQYGMNYCRKKVYSAGPWNRLSGDHLTKLHLAHKGSFSFSKIFREKDAPAT
jgi:hypothetical protein